MGVAAIVGGGLAAAGAIGGAVVSSKAVGKASDKAAQSAADASAVQKQIYNENKQLLSPYVQQGLPATAMINSLLGIAPTQPVQSYGTPTYSQQPVNALAQFNEAPTYGAYPGGMMDGMGRYIEDYSYLAPDASGDYAGSFFRPPSSGQPFTPMQMQGQAPPPAGTVGTTVNPQSAFDAFRNYTGYDFRLKQGLNAVNSGFAGKGLLQSGAALKSLNDYGQGMASAEFGNYLNALGNQQQMGLSAAQATAGVGSGYANSLGTIAMQSGANQANAALAQGQAMGGMVNSLGQIGGRIAGSVLAPKTTPGIASPGASAGYYNPSTTF